MRANVSIGTITEQSKNSHEGPTDGPVVAVAGGVVRHARALHVPDVRPEQALILTLEGTPRHS
jgi:hypothetical protein